MEIGLALLRLTTGLILATHGAQKLFGWFNGPGLDVTGQFFETIGFLPGRRHALMAGLAETGPDRGLRAKIASFAAIGPLHRLRILHSSRILPCCSMTIWTISVMTQVPFKEARWTACLTAQQ